MILMPEIDIPIEYNVWWLDQFTDWSHYVAAIWLGTTACTVGDVPAIYHTWDNIGLMIQSFIQLCTL